MQSKVSMQRGARTMRQRVRVWVVRWRMGSVSVRSLAQRRGVGVRRTRLVKPSRVWSTCAFIWFIHFLLLSPLLCAQAQSCQLSRVQLHHGNDSVLAQLRPQDLPRDHAHYNLCMHTTTHTTHVPVLFTRKTWTTADH
jgi:hypothetical protein